MKQARVLCDGCGAVKQQTNHWWIIESLVAGREENAKSYLQIRPWEQDWQNNDAKDVCGERCVSIFVSRWVATGYLEVQETVKADQ